MPDINIKADVKQTSTLGKVKVLVEQVVGSPSQESINQAVASYIDSHPGALSPLSQATKSALLQIAEKVAYIDEHGEDYYDALDAALSAKALLSITAVYTQSGTVYDTDSLDSLKSDLVVTAYYDDGTTADVTSACTLSGTLAEGTSTVTVEYSGKTTTFEVTVTKYVWTFHIDNIVSLIDFTGTDTSIKTVTGNDRATTNPLMVQIPAGTYMLTFSSVCKVAAFFYKNTATPSLGSIDWTNNGTAKTYWTGTGSRMWNAMSNAGWDFTSGSTFTVTEDAWIMLHFRANSGTISSDEWRNAVFAGLSITEVES